METGNTCLIVAGNGQDTDAVETSANKAEDESNHEEVTRQRDELLLEVSVLREQIDAQAERLKELEAGARSASDKNSVSQAQAARDSALLIRSLEDELGKLRAQLAFAARANANANANANINDDAALLAQSASEPNNELQRQLQLQLQQQQPLACSKAAYDPLSASVSASVSTSHPFAYAAIKRSQTMMSASPRSVNADPTLYEAIARQLLLENSVGATQLHSATSSSSLPAAYLHRASTSTSSRPAAPGYHQAGRIGYQPPDDRGSQSSVHTTPPAASTSVHSPAPYLSTSPHAAAFRRNTPLRSTVTGVTRLPLPSADAANGLPLPLPLPLPDVLGAAAALGLHGPLARPLVVQLVGMTPREARRTMMTWLPETLHALLLEVGLDAYVDRCRHSIKTVAHFVDAVDRRNVHRLLGIKNYFHRKKLYFWMAALLVDNVRASRQLTTVLHTLLVDWDHELVARWLDDAGLPEYKDTFRSNRVDGLLLEVLTVDEAVHHLRVTNELHHLSLKRAIQALRLVSYRYDRLVRRAAANEPTRLRDSSAPSTLDRSSVRSAADSPSSPAPADDSSKPWRSAGPGEVVLWTNARVVQWLASIDLAEFASHLRGSGVHGALMVLEPRFTAELLADVLAIPPSRTLLRRHLKTQFVDLLGAKVQARKREFAESNAATVGTQRRSHAVCDAQPLTLTSRVKSPATKRSSLLHFSFRRRTDKALERRALNKLVVDADANGADHSSASPSASRGATAADPSHTYLCPFNDAALRDISTELSVAFRQTDVPTVPPSASASASASATVNDSDAEWRSATSGVEHNSLDEPFARLNGTSPQLHVHRTRTSNSNSVSLSAGVGGGVMRSSVNEADEDDDPDAHSSSASSVRVGAGVGVGVGMPHEASGNPLKIALNDAALLPKMPASNV